jgi:hypothetical protein
VIWWIPIIWKKYTCTTSGSVVKVVPCENCSTEYVYVMSRVGKGDGASPYWLNDEGAAERAKAAAADMLQSLLEKDYDPVPCPVCGHYQRHMVPKLLEMKEMAAQAAGPWVQVLMLVVILIACLDAAITVFWSVEYLLSPDDRVFRNMVKGWVILLPLGLMGLVLSIVKRIRLRRFDPNSEDQQARIAVGRSRAVTKAEFEQGQRPEGAREMEAPPPVVALERHLKTQQARGESEKGTGPEDKFRKEGTLKVKGQEREENDGL